MTPWLRLTLRLVPLLFALVAAVPVYGTAPAYGAQTAPPDPSVPAARSSAPVTPAALVSASPAASRSASGHHAHSDPAAEPSRAGSRAGEGRMRPGRPDGPAAEEEGDDSSGTVTRAPDPFDPQEPETADIPAGTAMASAPPEEAGLEPARPSRQTEAREDVRQDAAPTEPTLEILPLGTGLVLVGVGLGLAFLGLRIRRG
ncbi:hypothetical protein [Streptomyces cellostaticus]|uniref:hypothetical protein n=1 Tax=Streptomyces cellostaticus TaxID=67285 RepID=UPI0020273477|nr:hypothetical protein [Streptomyces cellostaticus]